MSDILSSRGAANNKTEKRNDNNKSPKKGIRVMTMCYRKTAEEKYRACKRVTVFILVCMAAFIGLTVYNLLTGSPISNSSATFVCTASCALSLNVRNMRKAQEEMNN